MECLSCLSLQGIQRISPGPIIYEGRSWVVEHAYPTSLKGWLVIVLKRHVEALHDLTREEFQELADIQYRLAQVMRFRASIEKEYMMCFAEHTLSLFRSHEQVLEPDGPSRLFG